MYTRLLTKRSSKGAFAFTKALSLFLSLIAITCSICTAAEPAAPTAATTLSAAEQGELKPLPIPDTVPATLPERFNCLVRARKTLADGTNVKQDTKIYIDGGNIRFESGFPNSDSIYIVNAKTRKGYLLNLANKTYFEGEVQPGIMTMAMLLPPSRPTWSLTTREKLRDIDCEIFLYVNKAKNGNPAPMHFWRDRETWYPVRLVDESTDCMIEWMQYEIGPQDASLFVVPPGFRQDQSQGKSLARAQN
ncbi:MAG TPA: hypothetical protein VK970_05275 [Candidatus Methylacidiphilales bacterium]|nr:hypothetical protein [Candidatus Methylacidiphilales bacterium]